MNKEQEAVAAFHRAFDVAVASTPCAPDDATRRLRERLIDEEFAELREAMAEGSVPQIAKELADLLYVVYGTAVSCGMDMEAVFAEVHRSNMSKVGGHKREDGKWIKPASYSPARVEPMLEAQGWTDPSQALVSEPQPMSR
ncbi:MAG: MazG nucleotide pyrophosphohydrolase domain-containing protein [Nitrospiraceae bacterium]